MDNLLKNGKVQFTFDDKYSTEYYTVLKTFSVKESVDDVVSKLSNPVVNCFSNSESAEGLTYLATVFGSYHIQYLIDNHYLVLSNNK